MPVKTKMYSILFAFILGARAACWLLILLLVPSAESFGQAPEQETLQHIRIAIPPVSGGRLSSVAWDGGAWIAVGTRSTILRSVDSREWGRQPANAEVCFRNVTSGNGILLALTHCSTALLSRDGLPWERRETPGLQIRSAAFGRDVFVGVGDSATIVVSSNATAWTATVVGSSASLLCVRYADERFVAVGPRGAILTSIDGREWTSRDSKTDRRLDGVVHGDGTWVAVGSHGAIVTSPDGEHWTPRESGTEESLQGVAFGSGTFLAVGRKGCLLASSDARNWRSLPSCGTDLSDVAYGCDRFVAVGQSNTILLVGRNLEEHNPSVP
jgi:hypothetical protein